MLLPIKKKIISSAKGIPQDSEGGYNQLEEVLCGKEEKEDLEFCSLCIFWSIWKERNCIAFRNGTLVVQCLKCSLIFNLWSWNRMYIGEEASSIIGYL